MAKWERFELRLSEEQLAVVKRTAQVRGFRSVSGYIQAVLTRDLRDSPPDQSDREAFVAASIDRLSKEIRNLHTTQQALFAPWIASPACSSRVSRSHRPRLWTRRSARRACGMNDILFPWRRTWRRIPAPP